MHFYWLDQVQILKMAGGPEIIAGLWFILYTFHRNICFFIHIKEMKLLLS